SLRCAVEEAPDEEAVAPNPGTLLMKAMIWARVYETVEVPAGHTRSVGGPWSTETRNVRSARPVTPLVRSTEPWDVPANGPLPDFSVPPAATPRPSIVLASLAPLGVTTTALLASVVSLVRISLPPDAEALAVNPLAMLLMKVTMSVRACGSVEAPVGHRT